MSLRRQSAHKPVYQLLSPSVLQRHIRPPARQLSICQSASQPKFSNTDRDKGSPIRSPPISPLNQLPTPSVTQPVSPVVSQSVSPEVHTQTDTQTALLQAYPARKSVPGQPIYPSLSQSTSLSVNQSVHSEVIS